MKNSDILFEYNISLKILYILVTLYIASIVIFAREDNVVISNMIFLTMAGYLILHDFVYNQNKYYFNKELNLYFLFFVFATLSIFWSIEPDFTTEIARRMFMIFLSLVIIYNILMKYNLYSALFFGLFLGTFINLLMFFEIIHVSYDVYFPSTDRFMGTTENPNTTANVMFLSIFAGVIYTYYAVNRYMILAGYLNIAMAYYIILMTVSRTALVVSLGLISLLILNTLMNKERRKYFIWTTMLSLIGAVFLIDLTAVMKKVNFAIERIGLIFSSITGAKVEESADERFEFIMIALNTFRDNPFFGTGMDTARQYLGVYAHNNYAELLADSGIIGTTLFYLIYISLGYKAYFVKDKWIRAYLIMFVLSLSAYDMGGVSYYDKLTLLLIIFATYIAEMDIREKSIKSN